MLCPMMPVCRFINVFMTSWPSRLQPITGTLAKLFPRRRRFQRYTDCRMVPCAKRWMRWSMKVCWSGNKGAAHLSFGYEKVCGQVVAYAEESLTAQSVDDVHAQLLQIPVISPVVVIERLARDYADIPLEWRRSHSHAHAGLLTELPDRSDMAAGCEVFAFPETGVVREGTHTLSGFSRASSSVMSRTGFSNAECSLSASPTEIFS